MSDETTTSGTESATEVAAGAVVAERHETFLQREEEVAEHLDMLPGEVSPHPTPFKYVMIAVILCVATAAEVSLYYLEGDVANGIIVAGLLVLAFLKFALVASWYMHLKTDRPIFRRFFVVGIVGATVLYLVVLATLNVF